MNEQPTAAIAETCDHGGPPLPDRVCGVDRDTRLRKTLAKRGHAVIDTATDAQVIVPPCRAYAGAQELSLCTDGHRQVESALVLALRKDIDGKVAKHINRPISGWVTKRLMNTGVRPNHVTLFTILLGAASGVFVARGEYWAGIVGASLLQAQSVLDGVDGELSRLKFLGSKLGEWLDTICDDISNLSFFAGATYAATEPWLQTVGLVGIGLFVVMQSILYYVLATVFRSGNLQVWVWDTGSEGGLFSKIEWLFKRDFFCLLFLGLAIANRLDIGVMIFAGGAVISMTTLLLQLARHGVGQTRGTQ